MKLSSKQSLDDTVGRVLVFLNELMARLLGAILRIDHSLRRAPDAIIITKMLGLGSLLMAADAIIAIRTRYPSAKLILVCSNSLEKEARTFELFDEVWPIDDRSFLRLCVTSLHALRKSWKIKRLWSVNLEVYSRLSTIFSLWTLAKNRFGFYFSEVKFKYTLNTHHVYFNQHRLAYDNYEQMALAMGATVSEIYRLPVKADPRAQLRYIAVNNSCSELAKERVIPKDTLIAVLLHIVKDSTLDIALIGSRPDFDYNEALMLEPALLPIRHRIINVAGKYPFPDFLGFLKNSCAMMLTIDSGPLHFAYRLNMPTISVWGPTAPETRIPAAFAHEHIYLAAPCSPCVHHTDVLPCGGDNFCMKHITASSITIAIQSTLFAHYAGRFAVS